MKKGVASLAIVGDTGYYNAIQFATNMTKWIKRYGKPRRIVVANRPGVPKMALEWGLMCQIDVLIITTRAIKEEVRKLGNESSHLLTMYKKETKDTRAYINCISESRSRVVHMKLTAKEKKSYCGYKKGMDKVKHLLGHIDALGHASATLLEHMEGNHSEATNDAEYEIDLHKTCSLHHIKR